MSENLARALSARLEAEGVTTAIHAATDFLREERARSAASAVAAADLFVLVTPLYVDAFPALATHALDTSRPRGAGRRCRRSSRQS